MACSSFGSDDDATMSTPEGGAMDRDGALALDGSRPGTDGDVSALDSSDFDPVFFKDGFESTVGSDCAWLVNGSATEFLSNEANGGSHSCEICFTGAGPVTGAPDVHHVVMKKGPVGVYTFTAFFRGQTANTAPIFLTAGTPDGAVMGMQGQVTLMDGGWAPGQVTLNADHPVDSLVISLRFGMSGGCYLVDDVVVTYNKP